MSRMQRIVALAGMAFTLALGVCLMEATALAQKTKGKTRLADTKFLMRAINQPQCAALGKLLKEGPSDDKSWETALCHAAVLNEMSYVLMDDGRCPDKEWATAAKALRENSAKVLEAARAKDKGAAQEAFKKLTGSCSACHAAHKGK